LRLAQAQMYGGGGTNISAKLRRGLVDKMFDVKYELGHSFVIQLDLLSALSKIDEMLRLFTVTDGNKVIAAL